MASSLHRCSERLERLQGLSAAWQNRLAGALSGPATNAALARHAGLSLQPGIAGLRQHRGLRSLGVVLDHAALERALGVLLAAPERCAAMGEAGRERVESAFSLRVVSEKYRELWSELDERRELARIDSDTTPWPMAYAARLFNDHASGQPSVGPWWLAEEGSDPNLLTDAMQTCFLQQLIPTRSLASLADHLQAKRLKGGHWLNTDDLKTHLQTLRHSRTSLESPHQPA